MVFVCSTVTSIECNMNNLSQDDCDFLSSYAEDEGCAKWGKHECVNDVSLLIYDWLSTCGCFKTL